MGLPVCVVSERDTIDYVLARLEQGRGGWIVTANLDILRQLHGSAELLELASSADLIVADGMPLVWAGALQGTPLPERVAGSALVISLTAALAEAGASIFLLGGNPGTAEGAASELTKLIPGADFAGTLCPPFGFDDDPRWLDRIEWSIRESGADVVYVAFGFPKQERVIVELRATDAAPLARAVRDLLQSDGRRATPSSGDRPTAWARVDVPTRPGAEAAVPPLPGPGHPLLSRAVVVSRRYAFPSPARRGDLMSAVTHRRGLPSLLARGQRGIARYGWRDLSKELVMRSVRPALGPVAARRLRHRAETISSVDDILDLTFEFDAFGIRLQPYQSRWEFQRLLEKVQRLRPRGDARNRDCKRR